MKHLAPFDPRRAALLFRIWAFCTSREWNVTLQNVADAVDEPMARVRAIMQHAGWSSRVRATSSGEIAGRGIVGITTFDERNAVMPYRNEGVPTD